MKKNTNPLISDYDDVMSRLKERYPRMESTYHYEYDSRGLLHLHALITSPTRIYINKIHPGPGWSVDFRPTQNMAAWLAYITKCIKDEINLINEEYEKECTQSQYQKLNCCNLI